MRAGWFGQGLNVVAGAALVLAAAQGTAEARSKHTVQVAHHSAALSKGFNQAYRRYASRSWNPSWQRSALQCVPFARENSGIELSGNAGTWWDNASGLYERGARPEVGSILNFRANGRMRMGHVAVVTNVISPRHIEIDHANWGSPGRISRDIDVVDVSPNNDWTAVRVALDRIEDYGSVYPTYGFIYDRPDHGTMVANNATAPAPTLNPAPADLRPASERMTASVAATAPEEVAEAPGDDDDGAVAPRSYRSRHAAHGRPASMRASASHRGYATFNAATVYRVSTHGSSAVKPHKPGKRHF